MLRITCRQSRCRGLRCPSGPARAPVVASQIASHETARDVATPQRRTCAQLYGQRSAQKQVDENFLAGLERRSTIRETLKKWELDNPQENQFTVSASLAPGETPNNMFKSQALSGMREARQIGDVEDGGFAVDEFDAIDSVPAAPTEILRPGTLIELRLSDSRIPLLAIILGRFSGVYYFIANGGQLAADEGIPSVLFSVANFATPAEMQGLVDFIPKDEYIHPRDVANLYQPPLELCTHLQKKMTDFTTASSLLYQNNMTALSAADKKLPHANEFTTMSLDQIAQVLLPDKAKRNGQYGPEMLYAVHTALMNDETDSFRPLNKIHAAKHASYLYRISPASSIQVIRKVRTQVRQIMEGLGHQKLGRGGDRAALVNNSLWRFILKARRVIKKSRANRAWTDHGTLVPHYQPYSTFQNWTEEDKEFLHFIELWVGSHVHRESTLHTFGSAILHLTNMYQPAKQLNAATGWAFLQELGWIPSWELPTRHKSPIPGARVQSGGGYIRPSPGPFSESMREDVAANHRRDWGPLRSYCIDAPTTTLLDDAISLENTDTPGEYWIHAHIADPAAFIDPKSKLADYAAIMAMDHFIPGYRCSMFPTDFYDEVVMKKFSLDKGRPCLTFSTKLNEEGEVLDVKVQPGVLQNITFLTPYDVDAFCPPIRVTPEPNELSRLVVGPAQQYIPGERRTMSKVKDLSAAEKEDLRTMHRLLRAVDDVRLRRGAIPQSRSSRSIRVKFNGTGSPEPPRAEDPSTPTWSGDPAIEVAFDERKDGTLVGMAMMLAGESAAKWCSRRRIPVPYHTQPGALRNPQGLRALGEQIRAMTDSGEAVPMSVWRAFDMETGPTAQSVEPSPIIPLGLEMYTKVTSPLRRLVDCIVHWQIHAALAEEARLSHSLAGGDCSSASFLPWDTLALKAKLESLRLSHFVSHTLSRSQGSRPWLYQALLRAWKFGEADIPETFKFVVSRAYGHLVTGELDYMGFSAMLRKGDLEGVALMADVKDGDVLEVEIVDVNVYDMHVFVRALRRLEKPVSV